QVVNTSGNIETQNGDITIKTNRFFNHYEVFDVKTESSSPTNSGDLNKQLPSNAHFGEDSKGPYIEVKMHIDLIPDEVVVSNGQQENLTIHT
ncbi:hypothetical protein G3W16_27230, partial [Klebsiella pneumoniae]|uniref:hypothetical protein n=1 Tax=Klebsiella pneumoniae TaxID=573 RepID=UPI001BA7F246